MILLFEYTCILREHLHSHNAFIGDQILTSRKHLRIKFTPDFQLTYSKNGGNLGLVLNDKSGNFSIKSYVEAIY